MPQIATLLDTETRNRLRQLAYQAEHPLYQADEEEKRRIEQEMLSAQERHHRRRQRFGRKAK